MNALGYAFFWVVVQITCFSAAGGVLYLLSRRKDPGLGKKILVSTLALTLVVTTLGFLPVPAWQIPDLELASRPPAANSAANSASAPSPAQASPAPLETFEPFDSPNDTTTITQFTADHLTPSDTPSITIPEASATEAVTVDQVPSFDMAAPAPALEATPSIEATETFAILKESFRMLVENPPPVAEDTASASASIASSSSQRMPDWSWATWAFVLLGVGSLFGLLRIAIGLVAIYRYRTRSTPILDTGLLEQIDCIRAELNCTLPVKPYACREIASPATIGWKQPLLLLPTNWQQFSTPELKAVVAHEIAHIRHGDFLGWVTAQLSLAVHFYHPLMYWLAHRLREEQELAADAAAAALCGGHSAYLKHLASIALRQDDCHATWAARPFLSRPSTYLRRIRMLRESNSQASTKPYSGFARRLIIACLLCAGVFTVGLRAPYAQDRVTEPLSTPTAKTDPTLYKTPTAKAEPTQPKNNGPETEFALPFSFSGTEQPAPPSEPAPGTAGLADTMSTAFDTAASHTQASTAATPDITPYLPQEPLWVSSLKLREMRQLVETSIHESVSQPQDQKLPWSQIEEITFVQTNRPLDSTSYGNSAEVIPRTIEDALAAISETWERTNRHDLLSAKPQSLELFNLLDRIILTSSAPIDWSRYIEEFAPQTSASKFLGQAYFRPTWPTSLVTSGHRSVQIPNLGYYQPNEQTLIFATQEQLPILIAESLQEANDIAWKKNWQANHAAAKLYLNVIRANELAKESEAVVPHSELAQTLNTAQLGAFHPLWTNAQSYLFSVKLVSPESIELTTQIETSGPDDTQVVKNTLQASLLLARNYLELLLRSPDEQLQSWIQARQKFFHRTLQDFTMYEDEHSVTVRFTVPTESVKDWVTGSRQISNVQIDQVRLKQIGLALHRYHDVHGVFPTAATLGPDGKTPHSWRVAILPFLDDPKSTELFQAYRLDEPWDSSHNKTLLKRMPEVFRSSDSQAKSVPSFFMVTGVEQSLNLVDQFSKRRTIGSTLSGPGSLEDKDSFTRPISMKDGLVQAHKPWIASITDGTSNTIAVLPATLDMPWTQPGNEIPFQGYADRNASKINPFSVGIKDLYPMLSPEGFYALFFDGSVRKISPNQTLENLNNMLLINDGNLIQPESPSPESSTSAQPVPPTSAPPLPPGLVPSSPPSSVPQLPLPAEATSASSTERSVDNDRGNLKKIGLALHNYHAVYGLMPTASTLGPDGKTPHSWRVAILPFIDDAECHALHAAYRFDEPWDSEHNKTLIERMPAVFRSSRSESKSVPSYFMVTGNGLKELDALPNGSRRVASTSSTPSGSLVKNDNLSGTGPDNGGKREKLTLADITDGTEHTIAVLTATRDVAWTQHGSSEIQFEQIFSDRQERLKDFPTGIKELYPELSPEGFYALFFDGSVHRISPNQTAQNFNNLLLINHRNVAEHPSK